MCKYVPVEWIFLRYLISQCMWRVNLVVNIKFNSSWKDTSRRSFRSKTDIRCFLYSRQNFSTLKHIKTNYTQSEYNFSNTSVPAGKLIVLPRQCKPPQVHAWHLHVASASSTAADRSDALTADRLTVSKPLSASTRHLNPQTPRIRDFGTLTSRSCADGSDYRNV